MVIPTKAPAPDKPGPLGVGLDHEDWDPGRPCSAIKAVQAERHTQREEATCTKLKPESTPCHLSRCEKALA